MQKSFTKCCLCNMQVKNEGGEDDRIARHFKQRRVERIDGIGE